MHFGMQFHNLPQGSISEVSEQDHVKISHVVWAEWDEKGVRFFRIKRHQNGAHTLLLVDFSICCDSPKQRTWTDPTAKGQLASVPGKAFPSIVVVSGFLRDKHYTEIYDGATVSRMAPQLPLLSLYPKNNYQSKLRKSKLGNGEQEIQLNSQKQHTEKGVQTHYGLKPDHQMLINKHRQTPGGLTSELFSQL